MLPNAIRNHTPSICDQELQRGYSILLCPIHISRAMTRCVASIRAQKAFPLDGTNPKMWPGGTRTIGDRRRARVMRPKAQTPLQGPSVGPGIQSRYVDYNQDQHLQYLLEKARQLVMRLIPTRNIQCCTTSITSSGSSSVRSRCPRWEFPLHPLP